MNKHKIKNFNLNILLKLEITGKNFQVFNEFLTLFEKLDFEQNLIYWKIIPRFNKKDFLTVLKSPHVNKTAQEQFEYRTYKKCVIIRTFKPLFFLLLIKMLQGSSFPSVTLKVIILTEGIKFINEENGILQILNSKDIKLDFKEKNSFKYDQYIQLFDLYGGILCKKKYFSNIKTKTNNIFSSVG
jgi:Ribosomal protein S10p/S20e